VPAFPAEVRQRGAIPRPFFERPPATVAPELLGALLVCGDRSGRIVEVEAYGDHDDPASHAHRGPTARNASMFGPAGHLYVYRSYGIHWCANVVAHVEGRAGAVLVRALAPVDGIEAMQAARGAPARAVDVANGPGKLCQALGIVGDHDGVDLCDPASTVRLVGGQRPDGAVLEGRPRVGISRAVDEPLRFWIPGDPHRSRPW
jgi:DNA-3-methyladenine glycosylase